MGSYNTSNDPLGKTSKTKVVKQNKNPVPFTEFLNKFMTTGQ